MDCPSINTIPEDSNSLEHAKELKVGVNSAASTMESNESEIRFDGLSSINTIPEDSKNFEHAKELKVGVNSAVSTMASNKSEIRFDGLSSINTIPEDSNSLEHAKELKVGVKSVASTMTSNESAFRFDGLSFIKRIPKDSNNLEHKSIPSSFKEIIGENFPCEIYLKSNSSGQKLMVYVEKDENGTMVMKEGWDDCIVANKIQAEDFLMFTHKGGRTLDVHVLELLE